MGYQDRDYFRDEQSPYLELIRSTRISWGLFLLIFLGFCLCWITSQSPKPWLEYLRLDPSAMLHGWQWYRLVTACFASISFWHVLFAALLIWLSGHEVEERVGRLEFFLFVMVVGMLSNFVITAYYLTSVPGGIPPATGPAGLAIALFAWWAALDPRRPMQNLLWLP
ncbi:MAG TPA: rhomboid family intramembrane serine protease [Gemmatales bacterium]|nr:rhomboid family intramembrane serine protease [Gemmatales bacterium]